MHIVLFTHPDFLDSQSMHRYAGMLVEGLQQRGHTLEIWKPKARLIRFSPHRSLSKWLGYLDQYILFPIEVLRKLRNCSADTFFSFADNALGPWVPMVARRPHVIHCHDFLAQHSALGKIREYKTGWSGKKYQHFIRKGYLQGRHFISVSEKTKSDLHTMLVSKPLTSQVVYNGMNQKFVPCTANKARTKFGEIFNVNVKDGYILHVGGNQWYKNRLGVLEIYDAWRAAGGSKIPLILIGQHPSPVLLKHHSQSRFKSDIYFLSSVSDEHVRLAYAEATAFLFPSLAEGFGWPIAEAMAAGTPVITTNEAPMTEVAGHAGFLIQKRPEQLQLISAWATESAHVLQQVMLLSGCDRMKVVEAGIANAKRFDPEMAVDQIEDIYKAILKSYLS